MQDPQLAPGGLIEDVISTGYSVGKNLFDLATDTPLGLAEIPGNIMKVIDVGKDIVRNLQTSDTTQKVTLENKGDMLEKQNQVIVNKLSEHMPVVNTSSIPSVYSTEATTTPLKVVDQYVREGRRVVRVHGANMSGRVIYHASSPTALNGSVGLITPVNSTDYGTRLLAFAGQFQMYRVNSINAQYIPQQSTNQPGTVFLNFLDGTLTGTAFTNGVTTITDLSQRECFTSCSAYTGTSLTVKGKGDWLYVYNAYGGDAKFFASMMFVSACTGNTSATVPIAGYVLLTYDIEFMSAAEASISFADNLKRYMKYDWILSGTMYSFLDYCKYISWLGKRALKEIKNIPPLTGGLIDEWSQSVSYAYWKHKQPYIKADIKRAVARSNMPYNVGSQREPWYIKCDDQTRALSAVYQAALDDQWLHTLLPELMKILNDVTSEFHELVQAFGGVLVVRRVMATLYATSFDFIKYIEPSLQCSVPQALLEILVATMDELIKVDWGSIQLPDDSTDSSTEEDEPVIVDMKHVEPIKQQPIGIIHPVAFKNKTK